MVTQLVEYLPSKQGVAGSSPVHGSMLNINLSEMTLIGHIDVDAGIIWIGDPCYVMPDDASHRDETIKDWMKFCDAIHSDDTHHWEPAGQGTGICTSTWYGDGSYGVYALYENNMFGDRRPKGIYIDFAGEGEEEDPYCPNCGTTVNLDGEYCDDCNHGEDAEEDEADG